MKCIVCEKNHKYQHIAQHCFQEYMKCFDGQIVSGIKLSDFEIKKKGEMTKYYNNLLIHPKFKKSGGKNEN